MAAVGVSEFLHPECGDLGNSHGLVRHGLRAGSPDEPFPVSTLERTAALLGPRWVDDDRFVGIGALAGRGHGVSPSLISASRASNASTLSTPPLSRSFTNSVA